MRKTISILFVLVVSINLYAVTITDNFDSGISLANWDTFQTDAAGAPWTISAATGALEISKSADNDSSTMYQHLSAGVKSKFALAGNFSISIDFNLVTLPLIPQYGWNEAILNVYTEQGGEFYALRFTTGSTNNAEGFCNIDPYVLRSINTSTTTGKLKITRQGSLMSAYLNTGGSDIFLGQKSSSAFDGKAFVQVYAAHAQDYPFQRPNTALDVRFDNFTATADSIVPEPTSLSLLALGGLLLRKRK